MVTRFFGKALGIEGEARPRKARETFMSEVGERKYIPDNLKPIFDAEVEKSEEEIKFIEKANSYLQKELETLGIHDYKKLEPGNFCLVDREKLYHGAPPDIVGYYSPMSGIIFYNKKDYTNKFEMYYHLIHEMVHAASFHKYHVTTDTTIPGAYSKISERRFGYGHKAYSGREYHFGALNEALTDMMAANIIWRNWDNLKESFSLSDNNKTILTYSPFIKIIEKVIFGVARKNNEQIPMVRRRFMAGLFTGDILHLRDVEKTFGKSSLRILASIGKEKKNLSYKEAINLASKYFDSEDQKERDIIAKMLLSEYELAKYNKRKGIRK